VRAGGRIRRSGPRATVFVSHATPDEWVARQIARELESRGAKTFLFEVDVESGEDFEKRLVRALRRCTELLVLITPASVDRPYVWMEVGAALVQGKRVTAILYPWTFDELTREKKNIPVLIRRTIARNINSIDKFFTEFSRRSRRH
jgi:hypothetical protein